MLRTALQDSDQRVALAAARLLGKRGDTQVREHVERLSKEVDDSRLQKVAEDLLRTLE